MSNETLSLLALFLLNFLSVDFERLWHGMAEAASFLTRKNQMSLLGGAVCIVTLATLFEDVRWVMMRFGKGFLLVTAKTPTRKPESALAA